MTEIPAVVRATIAALRTAATWLPDEQRDLLYEAATVAENGGWEDACCPICQETRCDAGCPLEDFRTEMLNLAAAERAPKAQTARTDQQLADMLWPKWTPFRKPIPSTWHSSYQHAALPEGCYDASFGRVHVRPGCRC